MLFFMIMIKLFIIRSLTIGKKTFIGTLLWVENMKRNLYELISKKKFLRFFLCTMDSIFSKIDV